MTRGEKIYTAAELGKAVREARKMRGLTQNDLASRANVARGALQKLETGRGSVSLATAFRLLHTLSLDLSVESRAAQPTLPSVNLTLSSTLKRTGKRAAKQTRN